MGALYSCILNKGRRQYSSQKDDKNMLGNIGDMFVKCIYGTSHKRPFVLSVGGYYRIIM